MDETKNITTSNCILKPHKRLPQMTDCFKHFKKKILKSVHSGYWPEILDFFFSSMCFIHRSTKTFIFMKTSISNYHLHIYLLIYVLLSTITKQVISVIIHCKLLKTQILRVHMSFHNMKEVTRTTKIYHKCLLATI